MLSRSCGKWLLHLTEIEQRTRMFIEAKGYIVAYK